MPAPPTAWTDGTTTDIEADGPGPTDTTQQTPQKAPEAKETKNAGRKKMTKKPEKKPEKKPGKKSEKKEEKKENAPGGLKFRNFGDNKKEKKGLQFRPVK